MIQMSCPALMSCSLFPTPPFGRDMNKIQFKCNLPCLQLQEISFWDEQEKNQRRMRLQAAQLTPMTALKMLIKSPMVNQWCQGQHLPTLSDQFSISVAKGSPSALCAYCSIHSNNNGEEKPAFRGGYCIPK